LADKGIRAGECYTVAAGTTWWRVHRTDTQHVLGFNEFRRFGPVARFDPHPGGPGPPRLYGDYGVWYGAAQWSTALAEAFYRKRTIDCSSGAPFLTALSFARPLKLLNLSPGGPGRWPTRVGGNYALATAPHARTQRWAHNIVEAFPGLDGLYYDGRFGGHRCIALFLPAADAMPQRPTATQALTNPEVDDMVCAAADLYGYLVK
jgi:hypothetical protein